MKNENKTKKKVKVPYLVNSRTNKFATKNNVIKQDGEIST